MSHFVICKYCGETFDRDTTPFVAVGSRRYAHKECGEKYEVKLTQNEKDYNELLEYTKKIFSDVSLAKIKMQIRKYKMEYGYDYLSILNALKYFYEIKKNDVDKSNGGIGIVPYIYEEANKYFKEEERIKNINSNIDIASFKPKTINVTISSPIRKIKQKRKLFSFLDEREE